MGTTSFADATVCWVDLGTPDIDATAAFYTALFGWSVIPSGSSGYRLATIDGLLVAGLGPAEDAGLPYWTINLSVSDIHAATARCAEAGADIVVGPADAGPLGRYCVARDPAGSPFSLWQPGDHVGMELAGLPGTCAGISLLTDAAERAVPFYATALGWVTERSTGFRLPDGSTAPIAASPDGRSRWLVTFVGADTGRAVELGATVVREDPGGITILRDPTGTLFGLVATAQLSPAAATATGCHSSQVAMREA